MNSSLINYYHILLFYFYYSIIIQLPCFQKKLGHCILKFVFHKYSKIKIMLLPKVGTLFILMKFGNSSGLEQWHLYSQYVCHHFHLHRTLIFSLYFHRGAHIFSLYDYDGCVSIVFTHMFILFVFVMCFNFIFVFLMAAWWSHDHLNWINIIIGLK